MISVVIIEYNSLDDITKCVETLKQRCLGLQYEIIVSSNSCYSKEKQEIILFQFIHHIESLHPCLTKYGDLHPVIQLNH